jgi:hypothetical protein
MRFILLSGFLVFSGSVKAQLPSFIKSYAIRLQTNYPSEVLQQGTSYLITGITDSSFSTPDAFLMKVDSVGNAVFIHTYPASTDGEAVEIIDTSYLIADINSKIIKANNSGLELWNAACTDYANTYDLKVLHSGAYFVIGGKTPVNELHLSVSKYDKFGNLVSDVIADTAFGYGTCLQLASDKLLYGCGAWLPDQFYVDSAATFVFAADTNGIVSWKRTYTELNNLVATEIEHTYDGGYLLYGSDVSVYPSTACLIKLDTSGNVEWYKSYPDLFWEGKNCLEQDKKYFYLLGQKSFQPDTFSLIKTNLNGDIVTSHSYGGIAGCISRTTDSGFIMGAIESYFNDPETFTNLVLIKTDSSGGLISSVGNDPAHEINIFISPNPANETVHIAYASTFQPVKYIIYNFLGEIVSSGTLNSRQEINVEELINGNYLLTLLNSSGIRNIQFIKSSTGN